MSEIKASINLNRHYLDLLLDSVAKGDSIDLDFLLFQKSKEFFFYPMNSFSESLLTESLNFRSTKIKFSSQDELNSLLQFQNTENTSEFLWKSSIQKRVEFLHEHQNKNNFLNKIQSSTKFYIKNEICSLEITYPTSERYIKLIKSESIRTTEDTESMHSRNLLWLGEDNFSMIKNLKIGCVGAGGLINPFVIQAMHHGYRNFVLVDGDKLEIHNSNRFLGVKKHHFGQLKVEILKEILDEFSSEILVESIPKFFPESSCIEALSTCDLLVGGVDNDYSRLQIQILALILEKPYLDMGTGVLLKDSQILEVEIEERGGQIKLFVPGEACISCMGINPETVKDFKRQELDVVQGYIIGTELTPPSISGLNTSVACMAIKLMTDYVTNIGTKIRHLKYNEKNFKLFHVVSERKKFCKVCAVDRNVKIK